ncbi:MAG: TIGR03435 family protein [Terriglobus sp.]
MTRSLMVLLVAACSLTTAVLAQSTTVPIAPMPADATPLFDVAVIKPSDTTASHGTGIRNSGSHVNAFNFSVGDLIAYSYGLHQKQISAGSSPVPDTHFDIDGVPDVMGRPSLTQSRMMFQQLLVSRFKLAFHYEQRELPAYGLQIGKGGSKLTRTERKPSDRTGFTFNCQAVLRVRNASIADVAKGMQEAFLDKPVVDETGLQDRYDFDLKWTPDESQSYCPVPATNSQNDPNAAPWFYTALQEQLGLKLVPTKALIQVMVIDHLEKPSEN